MKKKITTIAIVLALLLMSVPVIVMATGGNQTQKVSTADAVTSASVTATPAVTPTADPNATPTIAPSAKPSDNDDKDDKEDIDDNDQDDNDKNTHGDDTSLNAKIDAIIKQLEELKN
jgi:hypothetical protein